jgi:alanine-glyoxylate transaminase/serine-glyoxylate transaminase/serine-pyruvate transaminase
LAACPRGPRARRLAEGTRKAVEGWGLKLLCKHPRWQSDSLTVIEVPAGIDSNLIVKNAYSK